MKRKLLLVLGTMFFAFSQSFSAPSVSIDLSEHTPANAAARSAVLPGWGQYFNGQETKGYIIVSGFVLTVLTSYFLYSKANDTYDDYKARGIKNDSLYSDYTTQSDQAMIASFVAAGVWAYGIADAYFVAKKAVADPYAKSDGLRIASKGDDVSLVYHKRF